MKCLKCSSEINENAKFCPECGGSINQSKDNITVEKSEQSHIGQKSICLVCKGKGSKRSIGKAVVSIVALMAIIPFVYVVNEGQVPMINLGIAMFVILGWGFSPKKCSICDGKGSIVL